MLTLREKSINTRITLIGPHAEEALENLYKIVNNVHSHLISGPDKATFDKLIKDMEKQEEIIGINLTNEEIAKITSKEIE